MNRQLSNLLQRLHQADYVLEGELKTDFENLVSVIAKGARVIHPRFGIGTVDEDANGTRVCVTFDKDLHRYEENLKIYEKEKAAGIGNHWRSPWLTKRHVAIENLLSVKVLLRNESN